MAISVEQFNDRVNQLLIAARTTFPDINARLARTALSLVRDRIINQGVDHNGRKFPKYSENPLPFFYFNKKGLGSGADKKLEAAKRRSPKGISYSEWRRINGLQTDHVDLKFTGETLADISVLETRSSGGVVTTVVASKGSISKKQYRANGTLYKTIKTSEVLEHIGNRYGNILQLSKKEEDIITEAFDAEVQLLLDTVFP